MSHTFFVCDTIAGGDRHDAGVLPGR